MWPLLFKLKNTLLEQKIVYRLTPRVYIKPQTNNLLKIRSWFLYPPGYSTIIYFNQTLYKLLIKLMFSEVILALSSDICSLKKTCLCFFSKLLKTQNRDIIIIIILFIFRERGREREGEGEKHQCVIAFDVPPTGTWPATQTCALTGNQTRDHLVHRPALNPPSHTSQGET